jgi:hypothetical protein
MVAFDQFQGGVTIAKNPRDYPDTIPSAESGRAMTRGEKLVTLKIEGRAFTYNQPGWWCSLTDADDMEGQLVDDDNQVADMARRTAKALARGEKVFVPVVIRAIRQRCGLTQREAGLVFGTGEKSFAEKTHVGDCRQPGQGFEFLGYRFEAGKRYVRKKSLNKLKDSIRAKTKRTRGDSFASIVADLNRTLRGWFGYFKQASRYTFEDLDAFTRRRLRALLRRQEKRSSTMGRSLADQQRWPNAYFAKAGLFTLHTAWFSARPSRC